MQPIHAGKNAVLVLAPLGESREVIKYLAGVGVKDVRPVLMHEDAVFIVVIVRVAADMRAFVAEDHFFVGTCRESFREHAPGKPRTDNQVIEHTSPRVFEMNRSNVPGRMAQVVAVARAA